MLRHKTKPFNNIMTTQNTATQNMALPAPAPLKVPQHLICKELAEKGYRAKQVSEITGIKYNNVAWYFSKYKLTEVALNVLNNGLNVEPKGLTLPQAKHKLALAKELMGDMKAPTKAKK